MSVTLKKETAEDLIRYRMNNIGQNIHLILNKWNFNNAEGFLKSAKSGKLENAEMDAITLRQLVADHSKYNRLLNSIKKE